MVASAKACTFCQIARGELKAHVVLDAPEMIAFLDTAPVFKGHVLLVPRAHHETLTDLPESTVGPLFLTAQKIARAVQNGMGADGTFVAMNNTVSQSVPHLHVHVIPRKKKDGLRGFFWPRQKYASPEEMAEMAARIQVELPKLG
jgi:histidine triad (HIT) family protein